jgi:hypothetical protein
LLTIPAQPDRGEWGESEWSVMTAKPLWVISAVAFDMSRRAGVPTLFQGSLLRLGVASFWTALALEGRAKDVWRDLRTQGPDGAPRAPVLEQLKEILGLRADGCMRVPAWSLPENQKARGLGLGRMWAVLCPFCDDFHVHSPGEELCVPHCADDWDSAEYQLAFDGELPIEHRERFYRSCSRSLPRLVLHAPDDALCIDDEDRMAA